MAATPRSTRPMTRHAIADNCVKSTSKTADLGHRPPTRVARALKTANAPALKARNRLIFPNRPERSDHRSWSPTNPTAKSSNAAPNRTL
jgi:hypothetical protein